MQGKRNRIVAAIITLVIIVVLAIPGWYVTSLMLAPGEQGRWIAFAIGAVLVFLLVGAGLALFFSREGSGRGNARAAGIAVVAALLFLGMVALSSERTAERQRATESAAPTRPAESDQPWAFAVIGGPILLLLVLGWASWRNRVDASPEEKKDKLGI